MKKDSKPTTDVAPPARPRLGKGGLPDALAAYKRAMADWVAEGERASALTSEEVHRQYDAMLAAGKTLEEARVAETADLDGARDRLWETVSPLMRYAERRGKVGFLFRNEVYRVLPVGVYDGGIDDDQIDRYFRIDLYPLDDLLRVD